MCLQLRALCSLLHSRTIARHDEKKNKKRNDELIHPVTKSNYLFWRRLLHSSLHDSAGAPQGSQDDFRIAHWSNVCKRRCATCCTTHCTITYFEAGISRKENSR